MKIMSRAMCIAMSTAMVLLLPSQLISTLIQAVDIRMLKNHYSSMMVIVRVPSLVLRLLRSLAVTSMYTVLTCM
jgi:hypothetical protein